MTNVEPNSCDVFVPLPEQEEDFIAKTVGSSVDSEETHE